MRVTAGPTIGVRVKAFAGSTGVLLAMNCTAAARHGLLGFAIRREILAGPYKGAKKWLDAMLNFPGLPHAPGEPVPSNVGPIQKFRWSDYTVYPGTAYRYTICPVYGAPGELDVRDGPVVDVTTVGPTSMHYAIFNRAVAGSQAFARANPKDAVALYLVEQKTKKGRDPYATISFTDKAYQWLSRGLLETIEQFVNDTTAAQALDVAIYEYQLPAIRQAIANAAQRGVTIRLLYHKKADETGDKNAKGVKTPGIKALGVTLIPRKPINLMHDKFMVRSDLDGSVRTATAALCGSTNFTENGVYRQANVVHVTTDADVASAYLAQFERIASTAQNASQTRADTTADNPIDRSADVFVGFSPRHTPDDLAWFVDLANGADRDLLFVTVFAQVVPKLLKAFLGKAHDDVLRIGVQNTGTSIIGVHKDRTATFVTPALLNTGLEGWLRETKYDQKGNLLLHCKMFVVNFTSDAPVLVSGSHNFTAPASDKNDENYLVVTCDGDRLDLADQYGVEIMRLYDHYRFRWAAREASKKSKKKQPALALSLDDSWTDPYFDGDAMKTSDRKRFCP